MNPKSPREAVRLARAVGHGLKNIRNVEVVLVPPFVFLSHVSSSMLRASRFKLGAQDCFYVKTGAYTGEISPLQLKALGVTLVIVGHSERRALGESDDVVRKKAKASLEAGLRPVLCVGEKEREREVAFPKIIREELRDGLKKIKKSLLKNLVIAYEPIWAIGTGRADTSESVYEMSILIRRELYRMLGKRIAAKIPILYGGSVDERNAADFVKRGVVDGLLVGGASLNSKKFAKIVKELADI